MNKNYDVWADQYLGGELTGSELAGFEKQLQSDTLLQEALRLQKGIRETIQDPGLLRLKGVLDRVEKKYNHRHNLLRITRKSLLKWAAAALLLALAGFFFMRGYHLKQHTNNLFNEHYTLFDHSQDSGIAFINHDHPLYLKAMELYDQQKYDHCFNFLKEVTEINTRNSHAYFYMGICSIELNNLVLAEAMFLKVIDQGENVLINRSKWYLSLVYLKKGLKRKSRELLEDLVETQSSFTGKATHLLRSL